MKNLKMLLAVAALTSSTAFSAVQFNFEDNAVWDSTVSSGNVKLMALGTGSAADAKEIEIGTAAQATLAGSYIELMKGQAKVQKAGNMPGSGYFLLDDGTQLNVAGAAAYNLDAIHVAGSADAVVHFDANRALGKIVIGASATLTYDNVGGTGTGAVASIDLADLSANAAGVNYPQFVNVKPTTAFPGSASFAFGGASHTGVAYLDSGIGEFANYGTGSSDHFSSANLTFDQLEVVSNVSALTDGILKAKVIKIGSTTWSQPVSAY